MEVHIHWCYNHVHSLLSSCYELQGDPLDILCIHMRLACAALNTAQAIHIYMQLSFHVCYRIHCTANFFCGMNAWFMQIYNHMAEWWFMVDIALGRELYLCGCLCVCVCRIEIFTFLGMRQVIVLGNGNGRAYLPSNGYVRRQMVHAYVPDYLKSVPESRYGNNALSGKFSLHIYSSVECSSMVCSVQWDSSVTESHSGILWLKYSSSEVSGKFSVVWSGEFHTTLPLNCGAQLFIGQPIWAESLCGKWVLTVYNNIHVYEGTCTCMHVHMGHPLGFPQLYEDY